MKTKPYSVECQEFGNGRPSVRRFATLDEASAFIQDYWQGLDFVDSEQSFHTDHCTYVLSGFTLKDIGHIKVDDPFDFYSRHYIFNKHGPAGT